MKSNNKNFTNVIRSYEDAVGFDEESDFENYEKFSNKKTKKVEVEESSQPKKPQKLRDNRRTDFENNENW